MLSKGHFNSTIVPYLLRAFYHWASDYNHTAHIVVDADAEGVVVPQEYIRNGAIVLNISPQATSGADFTEHHLQFHGRFGGRSQHIIVPFLSIRMIYIKEDPRTGFVFAPDDIEVDNDNAAGQSTEAAQRPVDPHHFEII